MKMNTYVNFDVGASRPSAITRSIWAQTSPASLERALVDGKIDAIAVELHAFSFEQ